MMSSKDKVFDDIARMAGGAVTIMSGVTKQVREEIRARVDEMATRMDLVPREDFDILVKRIEALEKQLKAKNTPPKTSAKSAKPKSRKKARS
jgi:BMFP domain-containing protein YqiC